MAYKGYALLDATTGKITEAEDRDMQGGEIYITNNAVATVITTANTFTRFDETTTFSTALSNQFDSPQAGRLRYIGASTCTFHCGITISISSSGANDVIQAVIYKNGGVNANKEFTSGTQMSSGIIEKKLTNASDIKSTAIHTFVSLTTNDYIELGIANITDTDDLTIKHCNLFAMEIC